MSGVAENGSLACQGMGCQWKQEKARETEAQASAGHSKTGAGVPVLCCVVSDFQKSLCLCGLQVPICKTGDVAGMVFQL